MHGFSVRSFVGRCRAIYFVPSAALVAAGIVIGLGSIASAAPLPVFGGPGGPVGPTGIQNAQASLIYGINNKGVALAHATSYLNGNSTGDHGYRWDAVGTPIGRFAGLSNITYPTRVGAINNAGVVVGYVTSGPNGDFQPVEYAPNSLTPINLSSPAYSSTGHSNAFAYLLNDSNMIAGYEILTSGPLNLGTRAVRWDAGNVGITTLGPLNTDASGATQSQATGLSKNGTIVGTATKWNVAGTTSLGARAVRWAAGTTVPFELDTPFIRGDGFADVVVRNVNTAGSTAGTVEKWAGVNSQGDRAVRWAAGGTAAVVLGVLGADVNGVSSAFVAGINDSGDVAGYVNKYSASNVSLGNRAVRWNAEGTAATELAALPGQSAFAYQQSYAYKINNLGSIAGEAASGATGVAHAVLWPGSAGGSTILDLNTLIDPASGWVLNSTLNVTDTGFVEGDASFDPDGAGAAAPYRRSFSMLVPQAGTYGMGDANFDTSVDFADLVLLAQHYNQANATKSVSVADLNLDGATNFADLVTLAQHYNTSLASVASFGNATLAADWTLARSLVPEPTMLGAIILTAAMRRRPAWS